MVIKERGLGSQSFAKPIGVFKPIISEIVTIGMPVEEREKRRVGVLNSEKSKRDQERQSVVWNRVRPLYERGLLNAEIEAVSGLSHQQIVLAIGRNNRPEWNRPKVAINHNRRIDAWKLRKEANLPIPEDKKLNIEFARNLFSSGLIPQDISTQQELFNLYENKSCPLILPKDKFVQFILEMYLITQKKLLARDRSDSKKYNTLNEQMKMKNSNWSTEQISKGQEFIRQFLVESTLKPLINRGLSVEEAKSITAPKNPSQKKKEDKRITFARELLREHLIPSDLSMWHSLKRFYLIHKGPLPENKFDQLRLEVFFSAMKEQVNVDNPPESLSLYNRMGYKIDYDWFWRSLLREEHFIRDHIHNNEDDEFKKREQIKAMVKAGANGEEYKKEYEIL